jgi:uncharacterized OB-fold protein
VREALVSTRTDFPLPTITEFNRPYWDALKAGKLLFRQCVRCGHNHLPARTECPKCLSDDIGWKESAGRGKLISWVVYHTAFHAAFAERLPYTVAIVELDEGARLISNVVGVSDPEALAIDQRLVLTVEDEHGVAVPRFRPE